MAAGLEGKAMKIVAIMPVILLLLPSPVSISVIPIASCISVVACLQDGQSYSCESKGKTYWPVSLNDRIFVCGGPV